MSVIIHRWLIFANLFVISFGATIYNQKPIVSPSKESFPSIYAKNQDLIGRNRTKRIPTYSVCLTPGCIKASTAVINNMDRSVNPCDDFYQFACGNFINKYTINNNTMPLNMLDEISSATLKKKRLIIMEPIQPNEPKPFRMAKTIYKSCMDQDKIEKQGVGQFKQLLQNAGGWPVLQGPLNRTSRLPDWLAVELLLRELGFNGNCFIGFSVGYDPNNITRRVIRLDQPSLVVDRNYLVSGKVDAYYTYMVDIAVMLGAERPKAAENLQHSLDFEISLARISRSLEERNDYVKMYNPMTVADLEKKFPTIEWKSYFELMLFSDAITQDDDIIVNNPKYISDLEYLLKNTPSRVAVNYAIWKFVSSSVNFLTNDFRNRLLKFNPVNIPRWKECMDVSWLLFPLPLDAMYVRRFMDDEIKKDVVEMVNFVREELYNTLAYADWMDDRTRDKAMAKANAMSSYIAYPDELLDDSLLNDLYKNFYINESDCYVKMVLNISKFTTDNRYSKLRQPIIPSDWTEHSDITELTTYYDHMQNSINLPASVLQGVLYSSDRPQYMNYGAIGSIIGHEMTHGFDDRGIQFDMEGNIVDWVPVYSKEKYKEKAKCFVEQYRNYTVKKYGIKVNSTNMLSENIADHGGLKQAYFAYNTWTQFYGYEPRLPGLQDFTPFQMFWISAANMYCTKEVPQMLKSHYFTDSHSPSRFRVISSMSNLDDFSTAFECPRKSNMNPSQKCYVW